MSGKERNGGDVVDVYVSDKPLKLTKFAYI